MWTWYVGPWGIPFPSLWFTVKCVRLSAAYWIISLQNWEKRRWAWLLSSLKNTMLIGMSDENALNLLFHNLCFVFAGKTTSFTAEWGPCNHAAPHIPCKEARAIQKCTIRNWGSCMGKVESTSASSGNLNYHWWRV